MALNIELRTPVLDLMLLILTVRVMCVGNYQGRLDPMDKYFLGAWAVMCLVKLVVVKRGKKHGAPSSNGGSSNGGYHRNNNYNNRR